MREFDLKGALPGAGASSENFKDQARPVDDLRAERLFKIALLHGRKRAIHHDEIGLLSLHPFGDFLDLALAEIGRGTDLGERRVDHLFYIEVDGACQTRGLLKARFRTAQGEGRRIGAEARRALDQIGADHENMGMFSAAALQIKAGGMRTGLAHATSRSPGLRSAFVS